MCFVLDANVFGALFDSNNLNHSDFRPALDWVVYGKGKMVYGGSKYKTEMRAARKYIRFFAALEKAGKIVHLCDVDVDRVEKEIADAELDKNFNDPHLVAIVIVSGCKIICTNDKSAIPYLKKSEFYKGKTRKPKIYQSKKNIRLLTDKYISSICVPCNKLNKIQISRLGIP